MEWDWDGLIYLEEVSVWGRILGTEGSEGEFWGDMIVGLCGIVWGLRLGVEEVFWEDFWEGCVGEAAYSPGRTNVRFLPKNCARYFVV